ncbi:MAG: histidinol-phosphatase [Treponema sp.]|nr:histidinol-phosphatase [Treponema sp.]
MKTNYHAHSTFCDGKASPEQMLKSAVEKHFDVFGFSSHSMQPFSSSWHIPYQNHMAYCDEIRRLKRVYAKDIEVMLGFEADYIEGVCSPRMDRYAEFAPDYLIGAVHFVPGDKGFYEADGKFPNTREKIDAVYGGDRKKAVQAYFECERKMLREGDFAILAHCDLIRIQNSPKAPDRLFDEGESWYREQIRETAKAIASSGVCVEINTGGMARGNLDTPYPSREFLEELCRLHVPVTVSSDAHSPEHLEFAFDEALNLAKSVGYTEIMYFTGGKAAFRKI